jgi:hypothetical protein
LNLDEILRSKIQNAPCNQAEPIARSRIARRIEARPQPCPLLDLRRFRIGYLRRGTRDKDAERSRSNLRRQLYPRQLRRMPSLSHLSGVSGLAHCQASPPPALALCHCHPSIPSHCLCPTPEGPPPEANEEKGGKAPLPPLAVATVCKYPLPDEQLSEMDGG